MPTEVNSRARGKRRGFSPGADVRHSQAAGVYTDSPIAVSGFSIFSKKIGLSREVDGLARIPGLNAFASPIQVKAGLNAFASPIQVKAESDAQLETVR